MKLNLITGYKIKGMNLNLTNLLPARSGEEEYILAFFMVRFSQCQYQKGLLQRFEFGGFPLFLRSPKGSFGKTFFKLGYPFFKRNLSLLV